VPELAKLTVAVCTVPTVTFPKATLVGEAARVAMPAPLPETERVALMDLLCGFEDPEAAPIVSEASPFSVTLPFTGPTALGVNVTVTVALWPAAIVAGSVSPLTMNAELLAESWVIATLVLPEFVSVAVFAMLWPNVTLPNDKLLGLTSSFPAATPFPETATLTIGAEARLLLSAILPAGLPAPCGVNTTVSTALCPGLSVRGSEGEVKLKDVSEAVALAMVRVCVVWFVRVSVSCLLLPTTTVPKSMLLAETVIAPLPPDPPPNS